MPVYTVDLTTSLNATVDVHAYTEDEARESAIPHVARMLDKRGNGELSN